jgi:hypothetical protein
VIPGPADLAGLLGVALTLAAYALLQSGRLRQEDPRYSLANAVGSGLILVSLAFDFNLSSAAIESAWLVLSVWGLVRVRRGRVAP